MAKKADKNAANALESVKDLTASNLWGSNGKQIAALWKKEKDGEAFNQQEEKLLNVIRLAFDVVHYNPEDERDKEEYGNEEEWVQLDSVLNPGRKIAIRPKVIGKITDLTMQNIRSISASSLLNLISRNFGNGWSSLPENIREVIESAFDISTSQLPTSRMHLPGGSMERKLNAGYEVLEIPRGNWTEAIFARKKEPIDPALYADEPLIDDGELITDGEDVDGESSDDTFYSSIADGPDDSDLEEDTEGLRVTRAEDFEE